MHLTEQLQKELELLSSPIRLTQSEDVPIKMNYKNSAFAILGDLSVEVYTQLDTHGRHAQFGHHEVAAFVMTSPNLSLLAQLIHEWLAQKWDVRQLAQQHPEIIPSENYLCLLSATQTEILNKRWEDLEQRTMRPLMSFDTAIFRLFRKAFADFYPFFSHDALSFSHEIAISDSQPSPVVFFTDDYLVVKPPDQSVSFRFAFNQISEAIEKTKELLPFAPEEVINPFQIRSAL